MVEKKTKSTVEKTDKKPVKRKRTTVKTVVPDEQPKQEVVKSTEMGLKPIEPKKQPKKPNYYDISRISRENADYNLIVGERGNGKTYAIQEKCLLNFIETREQCMILKRWVDDVQPKIAQNFWDGNLIAKLPELTNGQFTTIFYRIGKYILGSYDEKGRAVIEDVNTIGFVWSISESERMKTQSYTNVTNIIFEEFISLSELGYIPDNEISLFVNVISTIVRDRTNVKIWLLGNTVNPYNPYFEHFGIKGLELKQGDIVTKYDNKTGGKVAVEYCQKRRKGNLFGTSAKYFCWGNDSVKEMITEGKWQLPDYPTQKFPQKRPVVEIGVIFDNHLMRLLLIVQSKEKFVYIAKCKTMATIEPLHYILDLKQNKDRRYYTSIENLPDDLPSKSIIIDCLNNGKIWYQNKMIGAYFNNYYVQSTGKRL